MNVPKPWHAPLESKTTLRKRYMYVVCVASVSVRLFEGLKNFSFFERAKVGTSVTLGPIFAPPKSEKCLERALRKRLLHRLKEI